MNRMTDKLMMIAVAALLLVAGSASAQVIRVSKDATVSARQDVRLGDIAAISGVDAKTADRLANLIILPNLQEARTLRAEAILMAIVAQVGPGKLADAIEITGSANCDIKIDAPVAAAPLAIPQPHGSPVAATAVASATAATPATNETQTTLARLIVATLVEHLRTTEDDLRVSFSTVNPLLDSPVPAGKNFIIRPLTRTFVGAVQFEVQLVEGSRIVQRFNVQTQVLKRERVLYATAELAKGDVISKAQVRSDEAWLDRQMPTLFEDEKNAIGMEALRPVATGAMLDQRDFRPVEMAAKSEAISVYYVQGNLRMQMKGVAMQSGKLHDSIQVKSDSPPYDTYQATLIGKRLAVIGQVDEKIEKQLREMR